MMQLAASTPTGVEPARFPRYFRRQIALHNLLATRRPVLDFEIAGEKLVLSLGPVSEPPDLPHLVALSVGGSSAWLALDAALLNTLTAPWATGDEELPPALHKAVLIAALSPLLKALRVVLGARTGIRDDARPPPDQAQRLGLWETAGMTGRPCAMLHLDADVEARLKHSLEGMSGIASRDDWPALLIEMTLGVGQMRVSTGELASLEHGDILLLPARITADTHEFVLRQRRGALATGRLEGRRFIINRLAVEATMSDSNQIDEDQPQAVDDPEALEITLRFDLGQLALPLGELRQIQPGYSFELDMPASGEVRIVAGAQLIGRGELVQIEDRLGVRVTELFNRSDDD